MSFDLEQEMASSLSNEIMKAMDNSIINEVKLGSFFYDVFGDFSRDDFESTTGYHSIQERLSTVLRSYTQLWTHIIDTVWFGRVNSLEYVTVIHRDEEFFELIPSYVYKQQLDERYDADFYELIPVAIKQDPEFKRWVNVLKLKRGEML